MQSPLSKVANSNPAGNKPPWSLEAKARYLTFDSARAVRRVGLTNIKSPDDMFAFGHTVSPLRALHYIKANYSEQVFLATLAYFLYKHWTPPNTKLADEDALRATLEEATEIKPSGGGSDDGRKLFTKDDVKEIMDGRAAMKDALKNETQDALDKGAFGAPWLWVTNSKGESEPFFGSDRCVLSGRGYV
jgi:2-hydroxychromene-2-carboxylate isomerase